LFFLRLLFFPDQQSIKPLEQRLAATPPFEPQNILGPLIGCIPLGCLDLNPGIRKRPKEYGMLDNLNKGFAHCQRLSTGAPVTKVDKLHLCLNLFRPWPFGRLTVPVTVIRMLRALALYLGKWVNYLGIKGFSMASMYDFKI
jgi:hypothetical protein